MIHLPLERFRSVPERPEPWLWFVGLARVGILAFVLIGTVLAQPKLWNIYFLLLFAFAFGCSLWHLFSLRAVKLLLPWPTWMMVMSDCAVVAGTVQVTGGGHSFFIFLFVIVILEAGHLLGPAQSFLFASIASLFVLMESWSSLGSIETLYNFLIPSLAFYLSAFIGAYWTQRLHRLQQFQREILDNMNSGFLITDGRGIVSAVNKAGEQILRLPPGYAMGRPAAQVMPVETGAECPIMTTLRSQRDFISYEFFAHTGPDQRKLLGLSTSRIFDNRGHLTGLIASFTDLTEMARMRQELRRQDRLAVIGELAAGLAHEIRNPLASIRGAVDELRLNITNPGLLDKLAAIAMRESDHLNEIVTGFLDFARRPSIHRELFNVKTVLKEVYDSLLQSNDDPSSFSIRLDCPEDGCQVSGDPSQMRQVFFNLGKNAIEAMGHDGTLSISVTVSQGTCEIRFDDTGPGIEPDKVARIFEPFYTTKRTGVGMGLPVCLRIVTAHDGVITASSREGGGATMTVRLPIAAEEQSGA